MGSLLQGAKDWFRIKVFEPVVSWLKSGAEPRILARSAGVGFALGLCPLLGVSTMLCVGVLFITRMVNFEMHTAMALLANLLAVPVELATIVMHMRVGEFVTGSPHLEVIKIHLSDLWKGGLAGDLLTGFAHSILGWLLLLPVECAAVTLGTLPLFHMLKKRFGAQPYLAWSDDDDEAALSAGHNQGGGGWQASGRAGRAAAGVLSGPPLIAMELVPGAEGSLSGGRSARKDDEGWDELDTPLVQRPVV